MARAIKVGLAALVMGVALLSGATPSRAQDVGLWQGGVQIPFRFSRAAVVGGYVDSFSVNIGNAVSDTTAPIKTAGLVVENKKLVNVGSPTSIGKLFVITSAAVTGGVQVAVQGSVDGINWSVMGDAATNGVFGMDSSSTKKQHSVVLVSDRSSGIEAATSFGESVSFFPYIRFIVSPSGAGPVPLTSLRLRFFRTKNQ